MSLVDILLSRSQCNYKGITFIESSAAEEFLSYQDLCQLSLVTLSFLQQRGVSRGSEVVIQVDSNKTFLQIFWSCMMGGMIPVPLSVGKNTDHKQKLKGVWEQLTDPYLVVDRPNLSAVMQQLAPSGSGVEDPQCSDRILFADDIGTVVHAPEIYKASNSDIAFIQFSSGSTGSPKGVVLTHANLLANLEGISAAAKYTSSDTMLSWMPLTHDMGMIGFHLNPLLCGANQYIMPTTTFIRNPNIWLDKVSQHRITVTCSPNFGYRYLLKYIKETGKVWDLSCLRIIYNGAEPISESVCHEFTQRLLNHGLSPSAICPVYGLAEASVAVTISQPDAPFESIHIKRGSIKVGDAVHLSVADDDAVSFTNVGKPVRHCSVIIRDNARATVGEDVVGHVWIHGDNVTKGYYNNADASAVVIDNDGWLDTGDIGFFHNSSLYITGREKDIIFVNGQNFYSHDLELAAQQIKGIELNKIAITGYFNHDKACDEVIAFLFHRGAISSKLVCTVRELLSCISTKFGVIINRVIPVNYIPRTTSGKLQRFVLLERFLDGQFVRQAQQISEALLAELPEPEERLTDIETALIALWNKILQRDDIVSSSRFFRCGGDSLKAIELLSNVERQFGVQLTATSFFANDSIRELAAQIEGGHHIQHAAHPGKKRRSNKLSSLQKRIYYAWKLSSQSTAYNLPIVLRLIGRVDHARMARAFRQIVESYSALRMYFAEAEAVNFSYSENFAADLNVTSCKSAELDLVIKQQVQPFDLLSPPLFRFKLLCTSDTEEYFLFMDVHHIVMDGLSMQKVIHDLHDIYHNHSPDFSEITYADYVAWEEDHIPLLWRQQEAFWTQNVNSGIPAIDLPTDYHREAVSRNTGERLVFQFDNNLHHRLDEFLINADVSRQSALLAGYTLLLSRYSGQYDFVVGIPAQVQLPDHLRGLTGMLTNSIPFRVTFDPEETMIDYIKRTHHLVAEYLDHRGLPFDELLTRLDIHRSFGRSPLFDTMFLYQGNMTSSWGIEDLTMKRYMFDAGFSKFDLSLEVFVEDGKMHYAFEYSTDLFTRETISSMAASYAQLLAQMLIHLNKPTTTLHIEANDAQEKEQNCLLTPDRFVSVVTLFENQVLHAPEKVAIQYNNANISFAQLEDLSNKIESALRNRGVNKGDIVALDMTRSPELIAVTLACMAIGAVYLPLDTEAPLQRKKFIIDDSACKWLIINKELTDIVNIQPQVLGVRQLIVEGKSNAIAILPQDAIVSSDIAYVIYTSGTTGSPKGTLISHGSLANYVTWAAKTYLKPDSCFAFYSSVSFDLTVTSMFCPLVCGSKMIIYEERAGTLNIETVFCDNKANVIKLTPSHLRLAITNKLLKPSPEKKILIVGGEAFETNLAEQVWRNLEKNVTIYNEYGPTEATVGCMIYRFTYEDKTPTVPIGNAIDYTEVYILDHYLRPAPKGVLGEIYISGAGLAQGYLRRPELTNEKFISNPFRPGHMMYKTGDRARRLFNGNIEYHGRVDHQVKINGHRVELHEIEAVIKSMPSVVEAVVLLNPTSPPSLSAYYMASDLSANDIRNWLLDRLPYYMMPAHCIAIDHVPLTQNGKVDATKLSRIAPSSPDEFVSKNDTEEALINVWKQILNLDKISPVDNFFAIGGDSIKALQIVSRLFEKDLIVSVKDILGLQTIRNISKQVQRVSTSVLKVNNVDEVVGEFHPNPIQSWFLSHRFTNPNWCNQSLLLNVSNHVDVVLLKETVSALIQQHDSLRVNLAQDGFTLFYDKTTPLDKLDVPTFRISSCDRLPMLCNEIRMSLRLSETPLIRFAIIDVENEGNFLFITAHHLIIDGVSLRILLDDLTRVYVALRNGKQFTLPAKSISMKTWSQELLQFADSPALTEDLAYWDFMKTTSFTLPCENYTGSSGGRKLRRLLGQEETQLLNEATKPYHADVSILLNAALVSALINGLAIQR
ncbi:MAG: amino acid adenylation domain-containing protein [Cytophagales bacterium]|nr:amino acid adenylation domain-containing protein [Cytophagales bacterium]